MAAKITTRSSKKTQADLVDLVKAAGWKEDEKSTREWRWWHPRTPGIDYRLRNAADLVDCGLPVGRWGNSCLALSLELSRSHE